MTDDIEANEDNQPSKDWFERTFAEPKAAKVGCFGCATLPIIAIVAFTLYIGRAPTPAVVTNDSAAAASTSDKGDSKHEGEVYAVSLCDQTVKASLTAESSYGPQFGWDYQVTGRTGEVLRKFEATNAFGGKITSAYDCKYNIDAERVTFLQVVSPTGVRTLIGEEDSKPHKARR
jgi:hypothetical protein